MAPATFPSRLHSLTDYLPLLPLALAIWGGLLLSSGRYRSHRTVPLIDEAWAILRVCVSGAILFTLALYLSRWDERLLGTDRISRFWSLLFAAFCCLFLLTEKLGLRLTSRYVRAHGFNYRTVLIVGTSDAALRIADSIHGHRFWGYRILGFIRNEHAWEESWPSRYPILGEIGDIARIVESHSGGRRHLRRPPPRARPAGGPLPEPAGAGDPHPLRHGPLPAHPRPGGAGGAGRRAPALLLHHADEHAPAHAQAGARRGAGGVPPADRAADRGDDRADHQADLARQRPLPADPLRAQRPLLHPLQVPHDGGGRRGAPARADAPERDERAGVQAEARSAGDPARPLPAPLQPRRAAAALERAARRHEPGRPAAADPRGGRPVPALAAPPPRHEARPHLPLADQRPQQRRLRPLDAARPRVHRLLVAAARPQDPAEDGAGGAVGAGARR